ncbi:MAG: hypothetical protein ACI8Q3_002351 [Marinomonas primoryensis]|jgi:hypothetical protein
MSFEKVVFFYKKVRLIQNTLKDGVFLCRYKGKEREKMTSEKFS